MHINKYFFFSVFSITYIFPSIRVFMCKIFFIVLVVYFSIIRISFIVFHVCNSNLTSLFALYVSKHIYIYIERERERCESQYISNKTFFFQLNIQFFYQKKYLVFFFFFFETTQYLVVYPQIYYFQQESQYLGLNFTFVLPCTSTCPKRSVGRISEIGRLNYSMILFYIELHVLAGILVSI